VLTSEDLVLHQVHPAKLAADIGAAVVSLAMIWRGHRRAGLVVHFLVPVAASAAVLRTDTSRLRLTRGGRYVLAHMPPAAQAVRLAGDAVMTVGAWQRNGFLIAAGGLIVIIGWSQGITTARA
jgi:hypothetical protein